MNALQLKALLLNTITEIKFGTSLARNSNGAKSSFKAMVGLPKNASNTALLNEIHRVYKENKLESEFLATMHRMKAEYLIG